MGAECADADPSLLLDIRTELVESLISRGDEAASRWVVSAWPTCREATIAWSAGAAKREGRPVQAGRAEGSAERAARRARQALRRYCRHNDLVQMLTFTFGGEPPGIEELGLIMDRFWRRFTYATGEARGPWAMVPEYGSLNGRLHLHVAVSWYDRLGCSEVCMRCARRALVDKRSDVPPVGATVCIGCIWRHGFVGKPESNTDGNGLSQYLSKYLAKDFNGEGAGRQRYRVGEGWQPERVVVDCVTPAEAYASVVTLCGQPATLTSSAEWTGWQGPPVFVLGF